MLPFTREAFLGVFADYNAAIWPAQIAAYALAVLPVIAVLRPGARLDRVAAIALGAMWLFTGIGYHWLQFSAINPAAYLFGAAFVLEGLLLVAAGCTGRLGFALRTSRPRAYMGVALMAYAGIVYPLLGLAFHGYPEVPLFGVTPCPVTIFTLGALLLSRKAPWWLFPIPLLWSLLGASAVSTLKIAQDWGLVAAGIIVLALSAARLLPYDRTAGQRI